MPELLTVATLPLRQRILAQFISDEYAYHIDTEQKRGIQQLEMDVDNSYVQNMLLAAENVDAFKKATEFEIARVVEALKTVFPLDGKRTELSLVIHFFKTGSTPSISIAAFSFANGLTVIASVMFSALILVPMQTAAM